MYPLTTPLCLYMAKDSHFSFSFLLQRPFFFAIGIYLYSLYDLIAGHCIAIRYLICSPVVVPWCTVPFFLTFLSILLRCVCARSIEHFPCFSQPSCISACICSMYKVCVNIRRICIQIIRLSFES